MTKLSRIEALSGTPNRICACAFIRDEKQDISQAFHTEEEVTHTVAGRRRITRKRTVEAAIAGYNTSIVRRTHS